MSGFSLAPNPVTATNLINEALRDLGCLLPGNKTSPDILAEGLVVLNQRVDSWQLDGLKVLNNRSDIYPLTAGIQKYTIGPVNATPAPLYWFPAQRPTAIRDANIVLNTFNPVIRYPMEAVNVDEWADIAVQDLPFAIPTAMYYVRDFDPTYGFASIYLWPGPLESYGLELFTWQQQQIFQSLTASYNFPPGYQLMLRKCLAEDLIPMMSRQQKEYRITPQIIQLVTTQARLARQVVESSNAPAPLLIGDPAWQSPQESGAFNYLTGLTGRGTR